MKVTGRYEVQFILSEPFSPLPVSLGYNMGIVPKHALQGADVNANPDFTHQHPVGTGPYLIQAVRPGEYVRFVANANFYLGAPKIPAINFKIVPDQNVQIAQLKTGELTFVWIEPFSLPSGWSSPRFRMMYCRSAGVRSGATRIAGPPGARWMMTKIATLMMTSTKKDWARRRTR